MQIMRGLECERAVRASLCESELRLPRFAAAIASCHAASQRAAFCCVPLRFVLRRRVAASECCTAPGLCTQLCA